MKLPSIIVKLRANLILFIMCFCISDGFANTFQKFEPASPKQLSNWQNFDACPHLKINHLGFRNMSCVGETFFLTSDLYRQGVGYGGAFKSMEPYLLYRDSRLASLRSFADKFGDKNAVIELALYYETLAYSLSLFLDGSASAALAYKNVAMQHLEYAFEKSLPEAQIEVLELAADGIFLNAKIFDAGSIADQILLSSDKNVKINNLREYWRTLNDDEYRWNLPVVKKVENFLVKNNLRPYNAASNHFLYSFAPFFNATRLSYRHNLVPRPVLHESEFGPKQFRYNKWRCLLIEISKLEGIKIDGFREYVRCGNILKVESFQPQLRNSLENGNMAAAVVLGDFFLLDEAEANDQEGLAFTKLAVRAKRTSGRALTNYYSFVEPDIAQCNLWSDYPGYSTNEQPRLVVNGWGTSRFLKLGFGWGCFKPFVEVNGKRYAVTSSYRYGPEVTIGRHEISGCMEFANAKVFFHEKYKRRNNAGFLTISKYVNFNCGDDEDMSDFFTGKKNILEHLK